jgi:hypothetical protein
VKSPDFNSYSRAHTHSVPSLHTRIASPFWLRVTRERPGHDFLRVTAMTVDKSRLHSLSPIYALSLVGMYQFQVLFKLALQSSSVRSVVWLVKPTIL